MIKWSFCIQLSSLLSGSLWSALYNVASSGAASTDLSLVLVLDAFRSFFSQTEKINFPSKNNEKPSISGPVGASQRAVYYRCVSLHLVGDNAATCFWWSIRGHWWGSSHLCGKRHEAVTARTGEFRLVMADFQPVVVTSP